MVPPALLLQADRQFRRQTIDRANESLLRTQITATAQQQQPQGVRGRVGYNVAVGVDATLLVDDAHPGFHREAVQEGLSVDNIQNQGLRGWR